jgi:hypothetical protein
MWKTYGPSNPSPGVGYGGNPDLASMTGTRGNGGNFAPVGVSVPSETPGFNDWSFYPDWFGDPGSSSGDPGPCDVQLIADTSIEANCSLTVFYDYRPLRAR